MAGNDISVGVFKEADRDPDEGNVGEVYLDANSDPNTLKEISSKLDILLSAFGLEEGQ